MFFNSWSDINDSPKKDKPITDLVLHLLDNDFAGATSLIITEDDKEINQLILHFNNKKELIDFRNFINFVLEKEEELNGD